MSILLPLSQYVRLYVYCRNQLKKQEGRNDYCVITCVIVLERHGVWCCVTQNKIYEHFIATVASKVGM